MTQAAATSFTTENSAVIAALVETTKPRISRLVTITAVVGFAMAGLNRSWPPAELALNLLGCIVGTYLAAGGANALNMWMERRRDAEMERTASRPLPTGRLSASSVAWFGFGIAIAGLAVLLTTVGLVPAVVAAACVVSYLALYTPLKTVNPTATLAGAIPGALPPLIGWTAATPTAGWAGLMEAGGLSLFALMFVWQLPHFFAIAWLYRDDYAKGGYRMLPIIDRTGRLTAGTILATSAALLPLTLLPAWAMPDLLGVGYLAVAVVSGLIYLALCARVWQTRSRTDARRVFIASVIHLPVLLVAMVGEAFVSTMLA
ncbi:MAG: heme o synthase [Planctomycetota bacterium]